MRTMICCWGLFLIPFTAFGQLQETVHQTFTLPDSVEVIALHINGSYGVESWPGNVVMSETRISLYNGSDGLLKHMLGTQRYALQSLTGADSLTIASVVMEKPEINTRQGPVQELVDIRLFLPDAFVKIAEHTWKRKDQTVPEVARDTIDQGQ